MVFNQGDPFSPRQSGTRLYWEFLFHAKNLSGDFDIERQNALDARGDSRVS